MLKLIAKRNFGNYNVERSSKFSQLNANVSKVFSTMLIVFVFYPGLERV